MLHFFDKAPSFEAKEAHRYQNNRLGIFRARGGGSLDHPYAPRHPLSAPPTEERREGQLCYTFLSRTSIATKEFLASFKVQNPIIVFFY